MSCGDCIIKYICALFIPIYKKIRLMTFESSTVFIIEPFLLYSGPEYFNVLQALYTLYYLIVFRPSAQFTVVVRTFSIVAS